MERDPNDRPARPPIHCRVATSDDADTIAALHAESWRVAYRGAMRDAYLDGEVGAERRTLWNERLTAPPANQHVLVAEEGGEVVGFACAYGAADPTWGTELDNLHVRRRHHGSGGGTALLATVAAWCAALHSERGLYLWVLDQNHAARRFYERLGASDIGGDVWLAPDGSALPTRRYAWAPPAVATLAASGNHRQRPPR